MKPRAAVLVLAATLALIAAPAAANADTIDPQIAAALEAVPGGEVVDYYTAYWPDLTMTMSVPNPRLREAVGSCANGSVCAFSATALGGTKLSWTSCGTFSTTGLGAPVRSIADARSTGSLEARNGTTVVATAIAQSWNNVSGTTDNVKCS